MTVPTNVSALPSPTRRFCWWHAALIFVAANALSVLPAGFSGDETFYNAFRLAAVAPPGWLFTPMWLALNLTSLLALAWVIDVAERTRARAAVLWLEGLGWALFAVFNTLYFGLNSPVLGALVTVAGLGVGVASFACSLAADRRAAGLILARVLWLALATHVSVWVALNNADPFFSSGGF